ncbi:hypothetical protein C8Q77DRAFT_1069199 [Trametes polyzona]|nr:hypothetical protein C8Q77DRAFT_1069199 [Trametes polyzona]
MSNPAEATGSKNAGNALFENKKFSHAYQKYYRATKLDSTYAKASTHLVAASAKRALAALPIGNLSASDQKQKEQNTSELKAAIARRAQGDTPTRGPVSMKLREKDYT